MEDDYYLQFINATYGLAMKKPPPRVTPENLDRIMVECTVFDVTEMNMVRVEARLIDKTIFTVGIAQDYAQHLGTAGVADVLCGHLNAEYKKTGMPAQIRDVLQPYAVQDPLPFADAWASSSAGDIMKAIQDAKKQIMATKPFPMQDYYAAVDAGYAAMAHHPAQPSGSMILSELTALVPALATEMLVCPACDPDSPTGWNRPVQLKVLIPHLNDGIHQWSREQLADWLETLDCDIAFVSAEDKSAA